MNTLAGDGSARDARWSPTDLAAMREATVLAWRGAGRTGSNPMVGSVVVLDGRVVARGYHGEDGLAHAEVIALDAAGGAARGATLYASLEPCAHHGRTPPCTDRIIAAGVARVVIPALDPDPRVMGRGVDMLRAAGIQVDVGCLDAGAVLDNFGYYRDRLGMSSLITLKMALSSDGMVADAPGRRTTISSRESRVEVHALRAVHDAVVIGAETMRVDAPLLDCRLLDPVPPRQPVPVVFDSRLQTPAGNAWSRTGRPWIVVAAHDADAQRARAVEANGGTVIRCGRSENGVNVGEALAALAQRGHSRVLVEGGPRLMESFLAAGRWDVAWFYRALRLTLPGGLSARLDGPPGERVDSVMVGGDERVRSVNERAREEVERVFRARVAA